MPIAALLALSGCRENAVADRDPEWLKLEADRVKRSHQVELLKLRLSKLETRDDEFVERSSELDGDVELRALLMARVEELRGELAVLSEQVDRERFEWVRERREAAIGRSFATLEGGRGRTFEDAVITRVTDVGIEFRHATGTARLAAAEMSSEQQGLFGIDPELAAEALQTERATARAYETWIDSALSEAHGRAVEAALAESTVSRPLAQPVTASVGNPTTSRLRDEPRSFGRNRYTDWYPYYSRSRYSYRGTGYYCAPSWYRVRNSYPNIRVASSNWSYTPRANSCPSPVITPRRSFYSFTSP